MASERRRLSRGSDTAYRGSGSEWSSDTQTQDLLDRAPQFNKLVKAAKGEAPEPTPSQQEFLKDFAGQLTDGVAEGDDTLAPAAAPKPAKPIGPRVRPKKGR